MTHLLNCSIIPKAYGIILKKTIYSTRANCQTKSYILCEIQHCKHNKHHF
uniref:Uncharacterized protein n=1 Tax=Anguilla anguilla TaxID=7936 RepID=A0A0E9RAN1_ANGAN